jgi:hypothetical protein
MDKLFVMAVSWPDADAWLHGHLSDTDLLLHSDLTPQAVFGGMLPCIKDNRELISRIAYWRTRGARCLIFRTFNPIVGRHYERHGAVPIFKEPCGKETAYRYLMPPAAFNKYFSRFGSRIAGPVTPALAVILALLLFAVPAMAAGSVTLCWNACTNPIVAGSMIFYGGKTGVYTNAVDAAHATNLTIGGLSPATSYFFAGVNYTTNGLTSPFSNEVSYRVPSDALPPPPIRLMIARQFSTNHILTNLTVTASSAPATSWAWNASSNLDAWSTIATGAPGVLPVLQIPMTATSQPSDYFRLAY